MRSSERRKVNVLEMKCLESLVGVSRMDRVGNEEVRRRAGIERKLASKHADQRVLRWFGQEGVDGGSKWKAGSKETEVRLNGWSEGVGGIGNRGMTVEAGRQCAKDRKEWRS